MPAALSALRDIADTDQELARQVLGYTWVADDSLARHEWLAIEDLRDIAAADLELGNRVAAVHWLTDGLTDTERSALGAIRDIAAVDLALAGLVVSLPWLIDGVDNGEPGALAQLRITASTDPDLARLATGFPWFVDGLTGYERGVLNSLKEALMVDFDLGKRVASLVWVTDGVTAEESTSLYYLREIALSDLELARGVAALPWFTGGVVAEETETLNSLTRLVSADAALTRQVTALPWFTDGVTADETISIRALADLVLRDLALARRVAAYPWFGDGVTDDETRLLYRLADLASSDMALARDVAGFSWITDSVTADETRALHNLADLASADAELARAVAGLHWLTDDVTANERDALSSLHGLASADLEMARRVVSFPWFADGVADYGLQALTATRRLLSLTADFTDSDGDGMTDAAETKYGFDPYDASIFPHEPEVFRAKRHPIEGTGIDAYYEVGLDTIDLRWTSPEDGTFSLSLKTADSTDWNIYYGGHSLDSAEVELRRFNLSGTEALVGRFTKYALDRTLVKRYSEFTIDLAAVQFPDRSVIGSPSNRLSFTFSSNFPQEVEIQYREFLRRAFPILYERLGPPAETFNVLIEDVGFDSDVFTIVDDGRTLLTDGSFVPRLIVHEFVHAWKGRYAITSSGENWDHDDALSGFEEGTAEGMAFEVVHEYVRSYPHHSATIEILQERPNQYWSAMTTRYDAMKNVRWTGAGDFWTHLEGAENRYSIAATTVQMMVSESPNFVKEFLSDYYKTIRDNPDWLPNRDAIIDMWAAVVPTLNGYPLGEYVDTLPVFNGRKLDEGIYVLEHIRNYGEGGDQQFSVAYAIPDGSLWWGVHEAELEYIPQWLRTSAADDGRNYIDTQGSSFTVEVFDAYGETYAVYDFETNWNRFPDGTPSGLGWYNAEDLNMENFPVGLYKETVTFTDYIAHDEGARETYYFFGLKGFDQDREREYVIMVGVDGVSEGAAEIEILGKTHAEPITNGVAIFRSAEWPFDMRGRFPITITNAIGESRTYYRTLIEAGTFHGFIQHQFIIVDTDFDGTEDQFDLQMGAP